MDQAASRSLRWRPIIAGVIIAVVVVGLAFAAGRLSSQERAAPSTTSAEAGFARDMQVHHQQAVQMAMLLRDRTDDADMRLLAYDMTLTQSQQAGQLYGWLAQWGLPQASPEPQMTWMSRPALDGSTHAHAPDDSDSAHQPGSRMPGMASSDQIAALTDARGVEAERLFLTLMIAHHKGGIEMADAVLARSDNPTVTAFARGIVKAQSAEVATMTALLAKR